VGMPVWKLWGGKVREGVPVYRHTDGKTYDELDKRIQAYLDDGDPVRVVSGEG